MDETWIERTCRYWLDWSKVIGVVEDSSHGRTNVRVYLAGSEEPWSVDLTYDQVMARIEATRLTNGR